MSIFNIVFIGLHLDLIYFCNNVEGTLTNYSKNNCPDLTHFCEVDLQLTLCMEYDSLYLFTESIELMVIDGIVGIKWRNVYRISDKE